MKKVLLFASFILLAACGIENERASNDRFGGTRVEIFTDKETGCRYIMMSQSTAYNGLSPLYNKEGRVDGCGSK